MPKNHWQVSSHLQVRGNLLLRSFRASTRLVKLQDWVVGKRVYGYRHVRYFTLGANAFELQSERALDPRPLMPRALSTARRACVEQALLGVDGFFVAED